MKTSKLIFLKDRLYVTRKWLETGEEYTFSMLNRVIGKAEKRGVNRSKALNIILP